MEINRSIETHFGIEWERYDIESVPETFFRGTPWCIEYNQAEKCWEFWRSLDLLFGSTALTLVFMVARELILEDISNQFIPMWEM